MNFFNKIIILMTLVVSSLVLNSKAFANGGYSLSCTNEAYGVQLGTNYIQASGDTTGSNDILAYGVYAGLDCAYGGAGRTNSSAIVGGEIARSAANAVIGAVNGRLSAAMAMNVDTAAHMSYSSNGNGVGMAANHIVGGMSVWTNFSSSNFENDQTFSSVQSDSNSFDGDSSAFTVGLDKRFGNIVVGLSYTTFESDIDIDVNKGSIQTEGETLGLYVGLNTGPLQLSLGAGQGEYEIDTDRKDLGNNATISTTDITADVMYYHLGLAGELNRGKLTFRPRVNYRNFDLDLPAFTDIVPNDANTLATDTLTTADEAVAGKTYASDMTEAGLSLALSTSSKLVPFVDVAYVSESTTEAAYQTEATAGGTDLAASAPDGYITYGGGLILNLQGKMSGYFSIMETTTRTDYSETSISGSLRLKF